MKNNRIKIKKSWIIVSLFVIFLFISFPDFIFLIIAIGLLFSGTILGTSRNPSRNKVPIGPMSYGISGPTRIMEIIEAPTDKEPKGKSL